MPSRKRKPAPPFTRASRAKRFCSMGQNSVNFPEDINGEQLVFFWEWVDGNRHELMPGGDQGIWEATAVLPGAQRARLEVTDDMASSARESVYVVVHDPDDRVPTTPEVS